MSLAQQIFLGLGLGIATGIFLGEIAAPLKFIGDAYVHLLQMAVLPYIIITLISGLGKLNYEQAVKLALRVGSLLVLIWALTLVLARTRLGRGLRTIAEDSDTALLLGVDINRIVPVVFLISGLFAALAGVIFALNYRQVHPFMGEVVGLKGISAMIVGGMGNVWGSIAGGLIIGLVEVMSIGYFGADFVDIAVYGLLLLILFVRPTGLFAGAIAGQARA